MRDDEFGRLRGEMTGIPMDKCYTTAEVINRINWLLLVVLRLIIIIKPNDSLSHHMGLSRAKLWRAIHCEADMKIMSGSNQRPVKMHAWVNLQPAWVNCRVEELFIGSLLIVQRS